MAKAISTFFEELDFRLRSVRWSWGARRGDSILLRTWQDEQDFKARTITVLREPAALEVIDSYGLDERINHLQTLWKGEAAGYTVIVEVKDKSARPRKIKGYREDVVFAIDRLELRADGGVVAVLGEMVRVGELKEHSRTHRTAPAVGQFPITEAERSGLSTDSYEKKIPAIRTWLISICSQRGKVTYAEVQNRFGLTFFPMVSALGRLGRDCRQAREPIITALIVDKDTGHCSDGLEAEFGVVDDQAERERCYDWWGASTPGETESTTKSTAPEPDGQDDLAVRASRFAQVEVRAEQQTFRKAVFLACNGRCVVSGCDVPEALDAAHLKSRDWRQGHNSATDGVLLRKDLHALYDRGILQLSNGRVVLDAYARSHYKGLHGAVTGVPPAASMSPDKQLG